MKSHRMTMRPRIKRACFVIGTPGAHYSYFVWGCYGAGFVGFGKSISDAYNEWASQYAGAYV